MTRRMTLLVLTCAVGLLAAGVAQGGGFNIYEAGARGTALGGAFTATADDASAIFFNPAGLAWQTGHGLDLNLMPILPGSEFTGANIGGNSIGDGTTNEQTFLIPGLYYRGTAGKLSYGIGVEAPFGLGVEWKDPETWAGRRQSYDVDLATIYITPAVAYRFADNAAVSFGMDVAFTEIELNRFQSTPFGPLSTEIDVIDAKLKGTSNLNFTPVVGLMVKANDKLTFGAMYHHEKKMVFEDQDMTLKNVAPTELGGGALAAGVDAMIAGFGGPDQKVSADLYLPHILSLGAAYQFTERLRVEADAVHFGWDTFESLVLDFASETMEDSEIPENYESRWQYRFGASYRVTPRLLAMVGLVLDDAPQPVGSMSPMLPDSDRKDYSLGVQYEVKPGWLATVSYMYVDPDQRSNVVDGEHVSYEPDVNPPGTYSSVANIWALGLGYRF